jgi:hypothetical protein
MERFMLPFVRCYIELVEMLRVNFTQHERLQET